ncbi:hypothetical protein C8Q70DRAFT_1007251 [Cubamyces menziesii]|nr:hypothetical protein C8Q70DRAFT_1007251 [Cubamyces menziesii]
MPQDIDEVNAFLIGTWLQLLATGAYCVYLPLSIAILARKVRQGLSPWLPISCLLMLATIAIDFVTSLIIAYSAFHVGASEFANPASVYEGPATKISVLQNATTVAVVLISDAIIIYRTYLLWGRSIPVVIVPAILFLGDIAIGFWTGWTCARAPTANFIDARATTLVRYFYIITVVQNLMCSGLMCYKVWHVQSLFPREYASRSLSSTQRVLNILVESAALYCAHLLVVVIANSLRSNVFYIFLPPLPPVAACVFTMLIVRASHSWRGESVHMSRSSGLPAPSNAQVQGPGRHPISIRVDIDLDHNVDSANMQSSADGRERSPIIHIRSPVRKALAV